MCTMRQVIDLMFRISNWMKWTLRNGNASMLRSIPAVKLVLISPSMSVSFPISRGRSWIFISNLHPSGSNFFLGFLRAPWWNIWSFCVSRGLWEIFEFMTWNLRRATELEVNFVEEGHDAWKQPPFLCHVATMFCTNDVSLLGFILPYVGIAIHQVTGNPSSSFLRCRWSDRRLFLTILGWGWCPTFLSVGGRGMLFVGRWFVFLLSSIKTLFSHCETVIPNLYWSWQVQPWWDCSAFFLGSLALLGRNLVELSFLSPSGVHFRDSSDNFFVAIAVAAGCSCGGVSGSGSGLRLSYVCFGGAILTTCPGGGGKGEGLSCSGKKKSFARSS